MPMAVIGHLVSEAESIYGDAVLVTKTNVAKTSESSTERARNGEDHVPRKTKTQQLGFRDTDTARNDRWMSE